MAIGLITIQSKALSSVSLGLIWVPHLEIFNGFLEVSLSLEGP